MTRNDLMKHVLLAAEDSIALLESMLSDHHGAHAEDLAANTLLFAADQLAFALVRYRVEHAISPR